MRGLLKFFAGIIGISLAVLGLMLLFAAQVMPYFDKESRELGAASTTQSELAGSNYTNEVRPDLPVQIDGDIYSTNTLNAVPEIEGEALSDVSELNEAEQAIQTADVLDSDTEISVIPLQVSSAMGDTSSGQGGASVAGVVEQRIVELEWPGTFQVGKSGVVRIELRTIDGRVEAVAEIEDNEVISTPILLTDYYDTHTAEFTAQIVAPEFEIKATTPATQTAERGDTLTWRWSLKPGDDASEPVIALGINLVWVPKPGTDGATMGPLAIWGQAVKVEVNHVFGLLTVPQASILGTIFAIVGFLGQLPFSMDVGEWLFKKLFKRRPRRQQQQRASRRRR